MSTLNQLSEHLLLAVKNKTDYTSLLQELAHFKVSDIDKQLQDDRHKNAFWINIYNSFFQILRKDKKLEQPKIYTSKQMILAGEAISLDDIEHGILRRYRYKYGLGYLPNPFIASKVKRWSVKVVDFRIHFALNCGAKSCPPIAFYSVEKLEEHLELSTLSFLSAETEFNEQQKKAEISRLFLWFLGDFGGRKGVKKILTKYLNHDFSLYKLVYSPYSWKEHIDNYAENRFDTNHT